MDPIQNEARVFALVDAIVPLIDEFIPNNFFQDLPEHCGYEELKAKIYFLTELMKIIRLFPLKIYADPTKREQILFTLQEALDGFIAEEEAQEPLPE